MNYLEAFCHHATAASGHGGRRLAREPKHRRQTWLDLPAHGIEEAGHGRNSESSFSEDCDEKEKPRRGRASNACDGWHPPSAGRFDGMHQIDEQGEAINLTLHHLCSLGLEGSAPFFAPPRHEISVSKIVELEFHRQSMLMIQQDPGDETILPTSI